jgi:chromosome segregation and condensation protein ScpB
MATLDLQVANIWNATYKRQLDVKVYAVQLRVLNSLVILGKRSSRLEIGEVSDNQTIDHNIMLALLKKGLIDKDKRANIQGRPHTYVYGLTQKGREVYHYIIHGRRSATK